MSKNNQKLQVNQYANKTEEIRKAKGNPNKNIHAGKKNRNYKGYTTGEYILDKVGQKAAKQERVKLPTWMRIAVFADVAVIIVLLVLRMTAFQDNMLLSYITTLLLGLTCVGLFYLRQFKHTGKTAFYKVMQVLLAIVGVLYTVSGLAGLLNYWGVLK